MCCAVQGSGDGESPETPLFDSDVSKPLDPFPRLDYAGDGWEMFIRHPPKKKITAQRYWKKVWVRLVMQGDNPAVLLFNHKDDKDPFQELPLQVLTAELSILLILLLHNDLAFNFDSFAGKIFSQNHFGIL